MFRAITPNTNKPAESGVQSRDWWSAYQSVGRNAHSMPAKRLSTPRSGRRDLFQSLGLLFDTQQEGSSVTVHRFVTTHHENIVAGWNSSLLRSGMSDGRLACLANAPTHERPKPWQFCVGVGFFALELSSRTSDLDHARDVSLRPFARIHQRKRAVHEEVRLREAVEVNNPPIGLSRFDTKDSHRAPLARACVTLVRFPRMLEISVGEEGLELSTFGGLLTPTLYH
jgi:hypothetical protein